MDGVDSVVSYVAQNPTFAEIGLVGYALFGKKGLAAVLAGQALIEGVARITEEIGMSLAGGGGLDIEKRLVKEEARLKDMKTFYDIDSPEFFDDALQKQQEIVNGIKGAMSQMSVLPSTIKSIGFSETRPAATFEEFAARITGKGGAEVPRKIDETNTILKEIANQVRDQSNVAVAG